MNGVSKLAPTPWSVVERKKVKGTSIIVVDKDSNDVCEVFGETLDEARILAKCIVMCCAMAGPQEGSHVV